MNGMKGIVGRIANGSLVALAAALALALAFAPVHADTLTATDDTFVVESSKGVNFGSKQKIKVKLGSDQWSFAIFDLSVLPAGTDGGDVDRATLRLWIRRVIKAGAIEVCRVAGAWTEGALTWTTAQLLTLTPCIPVTILTTDRRTWVLVDITAFVKAWLDGTANHGIAIRGTIAKTKIILDSKENKKHSHPMEVEVVHNSPGIESGDLPGPNHPHGVTSSIIGGGTAGANLNSSTNRYVPMFYGDDETAANEDQVEQAMPEEGVVSDFYVFLEDSPGSASSSYIFTVRRDPTPIGADGGGGVADTDDPIRCTIDGVADSTGPFFFCTDLFSTTGHSQCYKAGDLIDIEADPVNTPDGQSMRWTALFTPCACTGTTCD